MESKYLKKVTLSGLVFRFGERILAQLVSIIVTIILARLLLPEEYGIISLVTIFITLFNVFVSSGLGNALVQKKNSDDYDFSTILWAGILFSIVLYAIIYFVAPFVAEYYSEPLIISILRIMGLTLPIAAIDTVQHALVSKRFLFKLFFFSVLGGTIVSGLIGITMAYLGFGVWSLVAQYLANRLIGTIVLGFSIKWRPRFYFSYVRFSGMFSFAWKKIVSLLINELYEEFRGLIIARKYSVTDLSYYSKGKQFPQLIGNNVSATLSNVMFPIFATIQENKAKLSAAVRRSMRTSNYMLFPLMIGFAVLADNFVSVILTDKWLFATPYIRIYCIVYILKPMRNISKSAINAIGRSDIDMYTNLAEKLIGMVIILIVMNMGVIYLAWSALITYIIGTLMNAYVNGKFLKYRVKDQLADMMSALILSAIMGIFVYFIGYIPINSKLVVLLIQIVTGGFVYFTLSAIFKVDSYIYIKNNLYAILNERMNTQGNTDHKKGQ
jgi:O-antigen/teichoic acid export membrane protein